MTKTEFQNEMQKMDMRDKERGERDEFNFRTSVENVLKLYFSDVDGSTYVRCNGELGHEDYLVEVNNPGDIAGHFAECLYADTESGFGMEAADALAKEVQQASMYVERKIPVVETDRKALLIELKRLLDKSEFETLKEMAEAYMPEPLRGYVTDNFLYFL